MFAVAAVLRSVQEDEFGAVRALLRRCGLSAADLDDGRPAEFTAAVDGGQIVGTAALQRFGDAGLLRSVAVDPDWRGHGIAAALVESIEATARVHGVRELWLLTTSAQAYFEARGYRAAVRADAPAALQASSQFASLCPASSACLVKSLR
jgi:amino-acid N-acetyltransferase